MPTYKDCDLCKKCVDVEFTVTSKHLTHWHLMYKNGIKHNHGNTDHIIKHICIDCYKKIFKED